MLVVETCKGKSQCLIRAYGKAARLTNVGPPQHTTCVSRVVLRVTSFVMFQLAGSRNFMNRLLKLRKFEQIL